MKVKNTGKWKRIFWFVVTMTVLVGVGIALYSKERGERKREHQIEIDWLLDRERRGLLLETPEDRDDIGREQTGIRALIAEGYYADAQRILETEMESRPYGIAFYFIYADLMEKQGKWNAAAETLMDFVYNKWGIGNIITEDSLFYSKLKEEVEQGNCSIETKEDVAAFMEDADAMIAKYRKLKEELEQENYQEVGALLEELEAAGADNDEYFRAKMEWLIAAGEKEQAKALLANYEERWEEEELSIDYILSPEEIEQWKAQLGE